MSDLYVVGKTNEREVMVASATRPFVLNEYLVIEDSSHGFPIGEIIETTSYKVISEDIFAEHPDVYQSLVTLYNREKESVFYIGKMKLLQEYATPMENNASIRIPDFSEIEHLLINQYPEKGFTIGVVNGTQSLYRSLPAELNNVAPLYEFNSVIKQNAVPFILDYYSFKEYPHIGLFGGSGSGKTFGLRVICEEIMQKGIPGIAFDPHYELDFTTPMKGIQKEHEASYKSKYEVFKVGENVGINFTELSSVELMSLLQFVGSLSEPMIGALETIHEKKDSLTSLTNRVNKLKKAFENMEKPEREREKLSEDEATLYMKHRNKIAGTTTLQAISWRLGQLERTGIFNHDVKAVEASMLGRKLAVIRGSQRHLKMIASYLIGKLYKKRRIYKDWEQTHVSAKGIDDKSSPFPPFFVIMDEAHNFAPNSNEINPTKQILREIAQEARKYGVFEIFGTQRPALLDTTITAQLNTKMIFRTGIRDDMEMIAKETNLNDNQVQRLPDLTSGNAFISSATLDKTMYVRFRTTKTDSPHGKNPFDELGVFSAGDELQNTLMTFLPLSDVNIQKKHSEINQKMKKAIAIGEIKEALDEMSLQGRIKEEKTPFGIRYSSLG